MMAKFHVDDDAMQALSDDVGTLWCRPVDVLDSPPDQFVFLRGKDLGVDLVVQCMSLLSLNQSHCVPRLS